MDNDIAVLASRLSDVEWWRLKPGLNGLKPFMPGGAIQRATTAGYGWPVHYEPVCQGCSAVRRHLANQPSNPPVNEDEDHAN